MVHRRHIEPVAGELHPPHGDCAAHARIFRKRDAGTVRIGSCLSGDGDRHRRTARGPHTQDSHSLEEGVVVPCGLYAPRAQVIADVGSCQVEAGGIGRPALQFIRRDVRQPLPQVVGIDGRAGGGRTRRRQHSQPEGEGGQTSRDATTAHDDVSQVLTIARSALKFVPPDDPNTPARGREARTVPTRGGPKTERLPGCPTSGKVWRPRFWLPAVCALATLPGFHCLCPLGDI